MFYADAVSGESQTGTICGLSSIDGFLVPALFILIPMCASTLVSKGGAVCGNSASTDLCGGRVAMLVPTATASADSAAGMAGAAKTVPIEQPFWPKGGKSRGRRGRAPVFRRAMGLAVHCPAPFSNSAGGKYPRAE